MSASLVGSEMCIRDSRSQPCCARGLRGLLLPDEGRVGDHSDGARDQGSRVASDPGTPSPAQRLR
eukprot:13852711-Alexandrium_andersonii.AAC.1